MANQTRFRRAHTKTKTGCDTCKRRRVKCDETRPFCLKCVSTGRTCFGYHPPRAWLFDPTMSSTPEPFQYDSITDGVEIAGQDDISHQGLTTSSLYLDWSAAYREPLISAFLQRFLATRSNVGMISFTGWPSIACKLAGVPRHEFLTTALMSLSLCMLSFEDDDPRLWSGAVSIYQQSLPRLRRVISRLSQCHSDSLRKAVIAACFVCGHAEYMMSSYANAEHHWEGVETIIHHGGPDVLEDDGVRRLYYDHRSIWTNICTARKKVPTHRTSEWVTVTEQFKDTQSATIFQRLWPILGDIPSLCEELENAKTSGNTQVLHSIPGKLTKVVERLSNWREDDSLPPLSSIPRHDASQKDLQLWQKEIENRGLEIATSLNYFSAYSLKVELLKTEMRQVIHQGSHSWLSDTEETQHKINSHLTAISETLPYLLDNSHGLEGVQHMPFIVNIYWQACETFDRINPEQVAYFNNIGARMRARGYRPINEPWLDLTSDNISTKTDSPASTTTYQSP